MDQRYTIIADDDIAQAVEKATAHQKRNGLVDVVKNLSEHEWGELVAARNRNNKANRPSGQRPPNADHCLT
jgi:hypothetical protein